MSKHNAHEKQSDEIDIGALFGVIWRGKFIIVIVTILAILAGAYYAYVVAVPLYRSTAVVILQTRQESIVDLQNVVGGLSGDASEVNSEVEIMRARSLMGKVVDHLDLTTDPEFNRSLQPKTLIDQVKLKVKQALGLSVSRALRAPERIRDATTLELLKHVTIRNVPQSLVFEVTVETSDAKKSALMADTIVEQYILNQLDVKFAATEQATSWLSNRVAELQQQLEDTEASVSNFRSSTSLVSAEALQALDRQIKELRDRILDTEQSLVQAKIQIAALKNAETRGNQATVSGDTQLKNLVLRAATDPSVAVAFDARFDLVVAQAELAVARLTQQLTALRNSQETLKTQVSAQSEELIQLQQLTREAEATRLLYEYFLTRLKETSAQQGIQQADSRILSNAVIPDRAALPRKSLILTMAGALGMIFGAGFVLLRETRNNGFRSSQDLESTSGYTVLGQVPNIPARNRRPKLEYLLEKPTSAAAEAIRNLRTSVMLSNVDSPPQVIVSTSSVPGEGKTTNSLALAQNIAKMGRKVLLIEGDIRRRTLNEYFDDLPEKGIVSIVTGEATLEETIHHSDILGTDMLVGDKTNINAADLFSSDKFRALILTLRERYDTIIIDTPPVLIVPDARIIAQNADVVLFTVKWDATPRKQVLEGLDMFRTGRIRVGGLVLSQINEKQMNRYGGRYGNYAAYGSNYYTN